MNTYYSEDIFDAEAVKDFSKEIKTDISLAIKDYKEAKDERDNQENLDYQAGEALVTFDRETSRKDMDTLVSHISDSYEIVVDNHFEINPSLSHRKKQRLKALENYQGNIVVKVNLDLDQTVKGAEKEFEEYECVKSAAENHITEISGLASSLNDDFAEDEWYLDRCNFKAAWDSEGTAGASEIYVAVVDTGCRITHEDLKRSFLDKYSVDVTQKDNAGHYKRLSALSKPYDSSHGTICSGIIAARVNNGKGIAGAGQGYTNDGCKFMAIKVSSGLDSQGKEIISNSSEAKGIIHAVQSGAEVISISLGSGTPDGLEEAIKIAKAAGVIVIASAGNENRTAKVYPAAFDDVIAVGGTTKAAANTKASFSNYGTWINIVAPATGYISTDAFGNGMYATGCQGTSMATPLVASAVVLMLAMNPDMTLAQTKQYLLGSEKSIHSKYFNCGLLDAGLAVQKAKYLEFKKYKTNLTSVTAKAGKKIQIKWNDFNIYGPEQIRIYRSTSKNGTYKKIKSLSGTDRDAGYFIDKTVTAGKTYYYKVREAMKYGDDWKYTEYSSIKSAKARK